MDSREFIDLRQMWMVSPLLLLIILFFSLPGCRNDSPKPAPIGNHAVLEELAKAYLSVIQNYPVQPVSMKPKGKKKFVEQVFTRAGYHYATTLNAMASQGVDISSQDQLDLIELLFLPHQGIPNADLTDLYSYEELLAVQSIQASIKKASGSQ